jgi:cell division protein FtsW
MQKMGFLPESHNDMIFSIICEELGLFGAIAIICVFMVLIWRILIIAVNAPDLFGSLIAIGVAVHVGIQTMLNIGVVTNFFPPTGIPLPFISYGGSSLIVLSISRQIKV